VNPGNTPSESRPQQGPPPTDKTKMALAGVLLAIPILALVWVPSYAKVDPELFGFPFFFWYQFVWVFICSGMTWTAYRLTLSARGRTTHKVGEDR
jgi:membrane protein implicated in regulation of membrane protease activity